MIGLESKVSRRHLVVGKRGGGGGAPGCSSSSLGEGSPGDYGEKGGRLSAQETALPPAGLLGAWPVR